MFVAAGYFAALDNDANGSFKERYHARFGDRAPALNASSQSVYEGFVHLQRQASPAVCSSARAALRGVRYQRGADPHSARAPIYLGGVEGLGMSGVGRVNRSTAESIAASARLRAPAQLSGPGPGRWLAS